MCASLLHRVQPTLLPVDFDRGLCSRPRAKILACVLCTIVLLCMYDYHIAAAIKPSAPFFFFGER